MQRNELLLVQQHDDYSCGRACVAMATGIEYGSLADTYTGRTYYYARDIITQLEDSGLVCLPTAGIGYFPAETMILAVPSLNTVGGMHWIYMSDGHIYDPQEGRKGKLFYSNDGLHPTSCGEVIVINTRNRNALIGLMEENFRLTPVV